MSILHCLRLLPQPANNAQNKQIKKSSQNRKTLVVVVYRAFAATTTIGKTR